MRLDIENIEELFSLASASRGDELTRDVTRGIAATLDYARLTTTPKMCEIIVDPTGWTPPTNWTRPSPSSVVPDAKHHDYSCPLYEFYVGLMAGFFKGRRAATEDTVITFNYDVLVEDALRGLGIPFHYGFAKQTVDFDDTARCERGASATSAIPILKVHGSLNWAFPGKRGNKFTVFGDYGAVRAADLVPILVPPTWRKVFTGQLGVVWDSAVSALRSATRVIIIGFSMPATDPHFKYLLAAGLQNNISLRKLLFVNPSATTLTDRVAAVLRQEHLDSKLVTPIDATTAQFFFSPEHRELIERTLADPYERSPDRIPSWAG